MTKVLVIEDEKGIYDTRADILTHYNYHVHSTKNGIDWILPTINEKPDLIICDINMPDLDGFKTLIEGIVIFFRCKGQKYWK